MLNFFTALTGFSLIIVGCVAIGLGYEIIKTVFKLWT